MIRIWRGDDAPASLKRWGTAQTLADKTSFDAAPERYRAGRLKFPEKRYYRAPTVKRCLVEIHRGKCCYCEETFAPDQLHVEHFRPKRGVRQSREKGTPDWPGYYWLAYSWNNLLLACASCNGSKRKGTLFPLSNPTKRARDHHQAVGIEKPLFVNPATQYPRRHIQFRGERAVGHTKAGRTTIDYIGLNREQLLNDRLSTLADIDVRLAAIRTAARYPEDAELQRLAVRYEEYIRAATTPQARFSSMAIDYLAGV